eukprot:CAMPEP_0195517838 /NCGR_PEP_ID=MMETSP0794_2-20130614/11778_1 /TAXON_ID=515487 /ORGANISM="Stephanopyxis turris, Strain CCMP 815" /LENGTH=413 /DNA_ID=CAMNT_0040646711 /DNA_START=62 /DNA_END=1303 /DNA_ORIENTATION=-
MKVSKRNISAKDGSGSIILRPENSEDLWHAYNLLQTGDLVRTTTLRKVVRETSTGSTSSQKKRLSLTIEVSNVEFDPDSLEVRLSGPNRQESEFVRMGAFHTLTLEIGRNFTLEKACWDQIFLDRIEEAANPDREAEIAAVVMSSGLAHVCLVTGHMTIVKAKIDVTIPKKRTGSSNHSKAINRFYEAVYQGVLRHIDFDKVKCVLLASPGFVKDDFFKYLLQESARREDRPFIENKNKFVLCRASSGHKHALEEVFSDPAIMAKLTDTKMATEVHTLNKFMRMIDTNPDQAQYGFLHVNKANEELAIDSLLVTDELFRSSDIVTRKKYVHLVESVRDNGGKVYVFSSLHVSGAQLQQVSGVAAILRFPMPDLAELEENAAMLDAAAAGEQEEEEEEFQEKDRVAEDLADMGL